LSRQGGYHQLLWNPELGEDLIRWKKHPHHAFYFRNRFKIDFRPSGFDGEAYRGVHVRTFAILPSSAGHTLVMAAWFCSAMMLSATCRTLSLPDWGHRNPGTHSYRRASIGSIFMARRAGRIPAASDTASSSKTTPP
jgi:hypothetical protein